MDDATDSFPGVMIAWNKAKSEGWVREINGCLGFLRNRLRKPRTFAQYHTCADARSVNRRNWTQEEGVIEPGMARL